MVAKELSFGGKRPFLELSGPILDVRNVPERFSPPSLPPGWLREREFSFGSVGIVRYANKLALYGPLDAVLSDQNFSVATGTPAWRPEFCTGCGRQRQLPKWLLAGL